MMKKLFLLLLLLRQCSQVLVQQLMRNPLSVVALMSMKEHCMVHVTQVILNIRVKVEQSACAEG